MVRIRRQFEAQATKQAASEDDFGNFDGRAVFSDGVI